MKESKYSNTMACRIVITLEAKLKIITTYHLLSDLLTQKGDIFSNLYLCCGDVSRNKCTKNKKKLISIS